MKICFLGVFSGGGTERICYKLANNLIKIYDIYIINCGKNESFFCLNEKIHYMKLEGNNILQKNYNLFKILKEEKIDIVVTLEAMTGIISIIPVLLANRKHIIWEHANYYQTQGSKYIKIIRKLELKIADAYIVLTKRDLFNFKNNFKIKTHIENIYNMIEKKEVEVEYDTFSKVIVSAGHIRKIKNFSIIPEIGKIIFNKYPEWCWKIYGEKSGEEYERIKEKIKEFNLEKNIVFCGKTKEIEKEYRKAAIYVMTSLKEGLPMVLLEAKSNKLPLVSFDIETGPDEIIRNGVNGFLISAYDLVEMAEKICILIENSNLRKEFSDNSIYDLEKFDEKTIVKKWKKLLEGVNNEKL